MFQHALAVGWDGSPIQNHQSKQEGEDGIHTQPGPWPRVWSMWKQLQTRPEALGLEDLHTGLPPRAWVPDRKSLEWEGTHSTNRGALGGKAFFLAMRKGLLYRQAVLARRKKAA